MSDFHTRFIIDVAREMKPKVYVGLGICGAFTINGVSEYSEESYGVDINPACSRACAKGKNIKFFGESTDKFAERWNREIKKEIDMIFIDADHSKEAVIKDALNFYPWLKKDTGIMFLHDVWPPNQISINPNRCGDCYLAKRVLKEKLNDAEYATLPVQYGVGIIRKVGDDWRN